MKRIYLDSNVFRNLKLRRDRNEKIFDSINNYIYYYSYAHLADLLRDNSDKKYEDLAFMENIVDQNFLNVRPDKEFINVELISPTKAFSFLSPSNLSNLNILETIDSFATNNEAVKSVAEVLKLFLTIPINFSLLKQNLPADSPLEKIIPEDSSSILQYLEKLLTQFDSLNNDPKQWKELRNYSIESLNFKNFDIDIQNVNFNEKLKDTLLQKDFIEFVEDALKSNKTQNRNQYNFFITAYICLNLLGIDKEKNSKVVFSSFQNDAQHAYYAAHCEYLVSDDEQLRLKAKALYNLFEIETQVLTMDEFYNEVENQISEEIDLDNFMLQMKSVFDNIDYDNIKVYENVKILPLKNRYFNYFNKLQIIDLESNNPVFAFYHELENYSMFTSYEEIEFVTNKIYYTLGRDLYSLKKYSKEDTKQIQNGDWKGRMWDFEFCRFYLEMNNRRFTLHYEPILH